MEKYVKREMFFCRRENYCKCKLIAKGKPGVVAFTIHVRNYFHFSFTSILASSLVKQEGKYLFALSAR